MSAAPEGSVKRIMSTVCAALLICAVLQPLKDFDIQQYALELAKIRETEAEILEQGGEMNNRLNRLVIESECESYIKDKAAAAGIETELKVLAQWSMEGIWVPHEVRLSCAYNSDLAKLISSELGIPEERQTWQN